MRVKPSSVFAAIGVFMAILVVGGGLGLYKYRQIEDAAANKQAFEPAEAVRIVPATEVEWRPMADLVGTVLSLRSVRVSNEIAGRVNEVRFESGSIIDAGEIIFTLDDASEQADLEAAEASVRVAQANVAVLDTRLRLAGTELERMKAAAVARAVSEMELDRAVSEIERGNADRIRLVAEVDQAKARVEQVQARLDKMTVRAPFRARAGLRNIHEGQYLAEGSEVVMLEEVSERIYLDFPIPQEYAPRVHPGLVVMAQADVLGDEPVRIEVVAADAVVNNSTRNLRVRAVVDNKEGKLRPGMFVQIRVPVEESRTYTVVPSTAIRRTSYADQIFIVAPSENPADPPGSLRAAQRFVTLGPTIGSNIIILDGVEAGEPVAATGSFKLRDGAKVMPVEEPAGPPTARAK